jgi:anti-sigma B factor antagonist
MQISVSTRTIDGIIIVDCAGRLVFGEELGELRETVKKLIPAYKQIVLNMKGVLYIDSGGLGTLVSLYSSVRVGGGELKLASLNAKTLELLQITKLVTVFDVRETETDAVLAFARAAGAH